MENNPLISIVVPVYNVEQYLGDCVRSLINQTYTNLEIILVDDGSPDRCGEMCEDFARQDARIKVLHQSNQGVSAARNHGLQIATGAYVSFIDSDDWLASDTYEQCLEEMRREVDIIMYGYQLVTGEDGPAPQTSYARLSEMSNRDAIHALTSTSTFTSATWSRLFRREILEGMYFFSGRMGEDSTFTLEAHLRASTFVGLDIAPYYYRQHSSSATVYIGNNLIDLYLNYQELIEKVKDTHPDWVPIINATAIRWLQGHYDDIVQSGFLSERYKEVFRNMRRYPFASDNFKNYLARWTFIHFPSLYSRLRALVKQ